MRPSPLSRKRLTAAPEKTMVPASATSASPSRSWKIVPAIAPLGVDVAVGAGDAVSVAVDVDVAVGAGDAVSVAVGVDVAVGAGGAVSGAGGVGGGGGCAGGGGGGEGRRGGGAGGGWCVVCFVWWCSLCWLSRWRMGRAS